MPINTDPKIVTKNGRLAGCTADTDGYLYYQVYEIE
jgi:hypothetical protein